MPDLSLTTLHAERQHPEHPCMGWLCSRPTAGPDSPVCDWHTAQLRAVAAGATWAEATAVADAATRAREFASFDFVLCQDCLSVAHFVLSPGPAMTLEVEHSHGCPAWDMGHGGLLGDAGPIREVALMISPDPDENIGFGDR